MHSFRHVAASLFIGQGLGPKRVQALMGHSTIQMTYETDGHLFPAKTDDQAAMQQIESRLLGDTATNMQPGALRAEGML